MKPAFFPGHALPALTVLAASLIGFGPQAMAQVPAQASAALATTATKTPDDGVDSNGFAPSLTATRKKPAVRGRNVVEKPYAPIRGGDDEGQIPEIEMFVGESRVFPTPNVARIAVGNGAAVTADALDGKEVILFANAVGTSSLFIWNADGRYQRLKINIVPGDTSRYAREIAAFLSTIPRAKASVVGANVIVEGDNLSDGDIAKIDELTKRYPQIVNFANRIGWEQMIQMDVKVVEFPVTALRQLGLDWSPAGGAGLAAIWSPFRTGHGGPFMVNQPAGAGGLPVTSPDGTPVQVPGNLNLLSVVNLGINAQLNLLQQQGKAALLAEPQLSARSGSTASFLAGGEIPYAVATPQGTYVQFKSYGVKLKITPRMGQNSVIRAAIETEVSGIDSSVTTAGGPALLSRQTNTEFNVHAGETIVLSGLLQREVHEDVNKVPFLGDIPILGALFRSTNYQNKETELVVFITPTLADSKSEGNVDRINKTETRLEGQMGPAPFLSNPTQPGVQYEHPNVLPAAPAASDAASPTTTDDAAPRPVAAVPAPRQAMPVALPQPVPPLAGDDFALSAEGSLLRVVKDAEPLRASPNSSGQVLRFLHRNASVVLGSLAPPPAALGVWRNVKVGDLNGWVRADGVEPLRGDLSRVTTQTPQPAPPLKAVADATHARRAVTANSDNGVAGAPQRFRVQLAGLQLHLTPDVNSAVLRRFALGDMVSALPQPRDGSWTAVQLADGAGATRGWVASEWIAPVAAR